LKPIVLFYNYQTIISGFLAVMGALVTVIVINKQIRQADRHETERRRRENFAARAMMPAALSELSEYSIACVRALLPLLPEAPGQLVPAELSVNAPPIPPEAVFTLRHAIQFGDDPVAENIADLIRKLQIQHSRIRNIRNWMSTSARIIVRANILEFTLDALEIYARCAKLFAYARRETDNAPGAPTEDDILSAAHNCEIWDQADDLRDLIKRRFGDEQ
jgi:hypothetical protein